MIGSMDRGDIVQGAEVIIVRTFLQRFVEIESQNNCGELSFTNLKISAKFQQSIKCSLFKDRDMAITIDDHFISWFDQYVHPNEVTDRGECLSQNHRGISGFRIECVVNTGESSESLCILINRKPGTVFPDCLDLRDLENKIICRIVCNIMGYRPEMDFNCSWTKSHNIAH